jgi:glyoxylase-like metal-dependent hydrolase (beta-lactamase superfamily II)
VELLRITDNLFLVPAQNQGRFPFSQSIYVDAERKILFDAGIGPALLPAFLQQFPVDIVIVSHGHPDHVAGCGLLAETAPVFVPEQGRDSFGSVAKLADRFVEGEEAKALYRNLLLKVMGFREAAASRTYDGKSAFDLGSVKLVALHTPGHTEDHYCFIEANSGVLLLFDIDLSPFGPWYGNRESSVDKYEASINYLRSFNAEVAVSSHMGVLRKNVDSALEKFALRVRQRDDQIGSLFATARTVEDVAGTFPFTPKRIPQLDPLCLYWEKQMVRKHVDRLVEGGILVPQAGGFIRR